MAAPILFRNRHHTRRLYIERQNQSDQRDEAAGQSSRRKRILLHLKESIGLRIGKGHRILVNRELFFRHKHIHSEHISLIIDRIEISRIVELLGFCGRPAAGKLIIRVKCAEINHQFRLVLYRQVFTHAQILLLQLLPALSDTDTAGPARRILVDTVAIQHRGRIDAGGPAFFRPGFRIPHRELGCILGDTSILMDIRAEIVNREQQTGIPDLFCLTGYPVDRIFPFHQLSQPKAEYEEQDTQVADPCAPDADSSVHRIFTGLSFFRLSLLNMVKTHRGKVSVRLIRCFALKLSVFRHRSLRIRQTLPLFYNRPYTNQVAGHQVHTQEHRDGDKPPAVEDVIETEGNDRPGHPLGIGLRIPQVCLSLRYKASGHAGQNQNPQQDQGKLHGTQKTPGFLKHLPPTLSIADSNCR